MSVEVRRSGKSLTVIIGFMSEGEAAEVEERLNAELEQGEATLTVTAVGAVKN